MNLIAGAALVVLGWLMTPTDDPPPLYEGLGTHGRKVTTTSPDAQKYFDQGLAFMNAFNHDEAIRSFREATRLDPECAMAWWGIAIANGPNINLPMMSDDQNAQAWEALTRARALRSKSTAVERALVDAAAKRYANPAPTDRSRLDRSYADAMRRVWRAFPRDADVGAWFAESMMDLRPWDLWKADGKPHPGTNEIVSTLSRVLEIDPYHPLALHLTIHALEASRNPERAMPAADRLRDLQPGLGHMVHMPSHIDVRTGQWQKAILANEKAMAADKKYRELSPRQGIYGIYMAHNHQMLAFAATMTGESGKALAAIDTVAGIFPPEFLQEVAPFVDSMMAMPLEVRIRFGKWDEVLEAPDFPEYFPIARAIRHATRAMAYSAKGEPAEARKEQALYYERRKAVPAGASAGNSQATDVLNVAMHLMNGEILVAEGKWERALQELRLAVKSEDRLAYNEPPDWLQPTRHTLGIALIKAGKYAEAEQVYRDDLKIHPNNGWALFGLADALTRQGKADQAVAIRTKFDQMWAKADIEITSSCLCIPNK